MVPKWGAGQSADNALYVSSIEGGEPRLLVRARSNALYVDDHLLYMRDGYLVAHRFDLDQLQLEGEPMAVAEGVRYESSYFRGVFAASRGILVFQPAGFTSSSVLQWYDRTGEKIGTVGEPTNIYSVTLSRDDKLLATGEGDPSDIWIYDLDREVKSRFTSHPLNDEPAAWSADNSAIFFTSDRAIYWGLYWKPRSGTAEERLIATENTTDFVTDVSHDDRLLLFNRAAAGSATNDIYVLTLDGSGTSRPYIATEFDELDAFFSPDQQWVAYTSNESGRQEIYITSFPEPSIRHQVSTEGGSGARWRADGRELFYISPDRTMTSVAIALAPRLAIAKPQLLFQTNVKVDPAEFYDVTSDGGRFIVNELQSKADVQPLTIMTRWSVLEK